MKKKTIIGSALLIAAAILICACGAAAPQDTAANTPLPIGSLSYSNDVALGGHMDGNLNGTIVEYKIPSINGSTKITRFFAQGEQIENPFVETEKEATSTFSSDVDTASYALLRKMISQGYKFDELKSTAGSSLRTEELVNYFNYECPAPDGKLFGVKATLAKTPYNISTYLLKLTLATEKTQPTEKNNIVFLIDVSGSMSANDKLPLLKKAFNALTERLGDDDVVSIVTYASGEKVVLDGCSGAKKQTILDAVNSLTAGGATNGEAGLQMAYQLAEKHFINGGNNRIFLASDGDLNVGIRSPEELKKFVEDKRASGVFLSVMGFGTGNYKDANMETLADNGNGVYYYIDGETEAEKVFGEDLFAALYTVAKDVKLQITFDKDLVSSYRLIGYENRLLRNEDFANDTKDAGDLGAGSTVTVFYELVLNNGATAAGKDFADLAVRYKAPDGDKSSEEHHKVAASAFTETPDDDFKFAAAVVELSLLLRGSVFTGSASMERVLGTLEGLDLSADFYKTQFKGLLNQLTAEQ